MCDEESDASKFVVALKTKYLMVLNYAFCLSSEF